MRVEFLSSNEASAEGAIAAGLKVYIGYPITPSSDLFEYLAEKLPKYGGIVYQAEDEIASINALVGAALAGAKAMTATSGPGFSLMQEGIGLAIMLEVPIVIVDVMRLGPATGQATKSGQGDVMQARWGRHGDQYLVVYSASNVYEAYIYTIEAFNTAEKLRTPVVLLIDELTGHLTETIEIPDEIEVIDRVWTEESTKFFDSDDFRIPPPMPKIGIGLNILYTGSTHDGYGFRKTQDAEVHSRLVNRLKRKIIDNASWLFKYEVFDWDDYVNIGFITYSSVFRSVLDASRALREEGYSVGILKLNTLWPIKYDILSKYVNNADMIIVPEMNLGQLIHDVRIASKHDRIYQYNKIGGGIPIYPSELVRYVKEVIK